MTRHVVIAGASGFLGRHLSAGLERRGHTVTRLVRRRPSGPGESSWSPRHGRCDQLLIERADVVINLAGSPTLGNPHSRTWARELRASRVRTTSVLARAIARAGRRPVFLAGNGISWYGDHGDAVLTEASDTRGHALLTEVTRDWQAAADPAVDAGARVCFLRTAPVMDRRSAPLKQLRALFLCGLGGRLGSGRQRMPLISLRDWIGGVAHLVEDDDVAGPVNLVCPTPPTNAEFTATLARLLHRPALAAVPAPVLRLAAGPMAPELLGSVDARPEVLQRAGYAFCDPDVEAVLRVGLS